MRRNDIFELVKLLVGSRVETDVYGLSLDRHLSTIVRQPVASHSNDESIMVRRLIDLPIEPLAQVGQDWLEIIGLSRRPRVHDIVVQGFAGHDTYAEVGQSRSGKSRVD